MMIQDKTIDLENLNQVTDIIEEGVDKLKTPQQRKKANEAIGQLVGVPKDKDAKDKDAVFLNMSAEQQNDFLEQLLAQYTQYGLSPAELSQKILEGLRLTTPQLAPATPAPVFGLGMVPPSASPAPGGMGGVTTRPQTPPAQSSDSPPAQQADQPAQWPPPYVPLPEKDDKD